MGSHRRLGVLGNTDAGIKRPAGPANSGYGA